jgi:hypothetical protein
MGKSKAPEYATTTTGTGGLFGSSTSNKSGTKFTGEDWQVKMGELGSNLVNQSLQGMATNDYSNDPNFQVYQDNFNRQAQQAYDANVLNPLANRGLMRSSGLQAATNSFNNTMANNLANLQDSYYNRQVNNLSNSLNSQNQLYNWITGLNNAALQNTNAVNDFNMQKYQAEQAAKSAMWGNLMNAAGSIAGAGLTGGLSLAGNKAIAGALSGGSGFGGGSLLSNAINNEVMGL